MKLIHLYRGCLLCPAFYYYCFKPSTDIKNISISYALRNAWGKKNIFNLTSPCQQSSKFGVDKICQNMILNQSNLCLNAKGMTIGSGELCYSIRAPAHWGCMCLCVFLTVVIAVHNAYSGLLNSVIKHTIHKALEMDFC